MDPQLCITLFRELERDGFGGRFHLQAAGGTPSISSWASAHHALALRHVDPAAAAEELRTVYSACQGENGLVLATRALDEGPEATPFIGPPVAAFAVARLVLADQADAALLACATRELDAIWGERLPPDTDLPVIFHPAESGTPESPLYDAVIESRAGEDRVRELDTLARSASACGLDPDRALRAGHPFVMEDPVFCGWFLLALEECQRASEKCGDDVMVQKLRIRAGMIADAIADRLWWGEEELFVARDRQRDGLLSVATAGGLVAVASRALGESPHGRRAASRQLSPGSPLWGSRGISFNPIVRDRSTEGHESAWRGNSASACTQLWAHLVLMRVGRQADARLCRTQLDSLVESGGFRGHYDASSGEARGLRDFAQATIGLELAALET